MKSSPEIICTSLIRDDGVPHTQQSVDRTDANWLCAGQGSLAPVITKPVLF